VAEGRRYTFEDSIRQNLRQLEREVDEKRQALGRLARDRSADLERVSAGQLQALQDSTAYKTAEIRAIENLRRDIAAALEESTDRQRAALDRVATLWLGRIEKAGRKARRAGSWRRNTPPVAAVVFAIAAAIGGTLLLRDGEHERSRATPASAPEVTLALPAYSPIPGTTPSTSAAQPPNAAPPTDASADLAPIHWRADQTPSTPQPASSAPASASASPAPAPPPPAAAPLPQQAQPPPSSTDTAGSQNPRQPINGGASRASSQSSSPTPQFPPGWAKQLDG
jgi:hypothetical protein